MARHHPQSRSLALGLLVWLTAGLSAVNGSDLPRADWGIDGVITLFPRDDADFEGYVELLKDSGVPWVRERGINPKPELQTRLRAMNDAGLHVVAFAGTPGAPGPQRPGNQLTEDLLAVYRASFGLARDYADVVTAWEMPGEPDIGYCRDLPERLTAYNKAMYLGLHDGAAAADRPVIVLNGALGLPPGPWLERATANGFFDYTDAANIHFYGLASDLEGVIASHRAFLREHVDLRDREPLPTRRLRFGEKGWRPHRPTKGGPAPLSLRRPGLPIWLTECGTNVISADDFLNPERRAYQAKFAAETALIAWRQPDLAILMPFILVRKDDGHAMTLSATEPLPAWTSYADVVRRNPWPDRALVQRPKAPSRLVLQWLPAAGQGLPHKMAGTYRFVDNTPMEGEVRVYNFGKQERRGRLNWTRPGSVGVTLADPGELIVPPMGSVVVPLSFMPKSAGYFRDQWRIEFLPTDGGAETWPLSFGLERQPNAADFTLAPMRVTAEPGRDWERLLLPGSKLTSVRGPWRGVNGVEVMSDSGEKAIASFRIMAPKAHPLQPPGAVAGVQGLPGDGFLRVTTDQEFQVFRRVRLDLIDDRGQRFTIWENGGFDYQGDRRELWLSFEDLHLYFWGRATPRPRFDPTRIVQLQIRVYAPNTAEEIPIWIEVAQPK